VSATIFANSGLITPQITSMSETVRRILEDAKSTPRPNQRVFIPEIDDYAFVVPNVLDEDTMFPSRKHTARYLRTSQ
jgi:hypothetical protein